MTRSHRREHVFKILFRYEFFDPNDFKEQAELYFEDVVKDLSEDDTYIDDTISDADKEDIISRVLDIYEHINDIDEKLSKVSEGWKLERIGKAELSILRNAAYEIMYDPELDNAVAISEAVILSGKYCNEKSHSFVNGILAKLI